MSKTRFVGQPVGVEGSPRVAGRGVALLSRSALSDAKRGYGGFPHDSCSLFDDCDEKDIAVRVWAPVVVNPLGMAASGSQPNGHANKPTTKRSFGSSNGGKG